MPDASLDDYIAAAARVLDLPIDSAWQPAVRANLEMTLRLSAVVPRFPLPGAGGAGTAVGGVTYGGGYIGRARRSRLGFGRRDRRGGRGRPRHRRRGDRGRARA